MTIFRIAAPFSRCNFEPCKSLYYIASFLMGSVCE
jgi:hypothetical protein